MPHSISLDLDKVLTDDDTSIALVHRLFSSDFALRKEAESLLECAKRTQLDEISLRLLRVTSLTEAFQEIRGIATVLLRNLLVDNPSFIVFFLQLKKETCKNIRGSLKEDFQE
ncbi:importin-5-like protein [Corchorus olitorius]|uniref:Importin-5-like protein n=1 Tax=Corchorus olitorius TaxID=93759 RepID=A0A1R3KDX8_9ROSI|nr:importin-5-like protein [Corchorus olitorius]